MLKTPLLDISGRRLHEVILKAAPAGNSWQVEANAKEAAGQINWDGAGQGRVKARLKYLTLPESTPQQEAMQRLGEAESQDELPGLDIIADSFTLGSRRFGKLEQRLVTLPMVLGAKAPGRWRRLPQRYLYRLLLTA